MELLTSIVDLDSIQVKNPPFTPEQKATQIEALANTIIKLGGLINIPIVQQVDIEEYELISGYLEYYAYRKACETNPHLPDRMMVFIANYKNQAGIQQQLEVLQAIESTQKDLSQILTPNQSEVSLQIKNLESTIEKNNQNFAAAIGQLQTELLSVVEETAPKPIPPLNLFNDISKAESAFQVQRELEKLLGTKKAKKIVDQLQDDYNRKEHKLFESFDAVLNILKVQQGKRAVGLISKEKMLKFIDLFQPSTSEQKANKQSHQLESFTKSSNQSFVTAIEQLQPVFVVIKTRFRQYVSPLEAFNRILEPEIEVLVQHKLEFLGISKSRRIVEKLQEVSKQKSPQPFQSFAEVLNASKEIKGSKSTRLISEKTMIAVLDRWNY